MLFNILLLSEKSNVVNAQAVNSLLSISIRQTDRSVLALYPCLNPTLRASYSPLCLTIVSANGYLLIFCHFSFYWRFDFCVKKREKKKSEFTFLCHLDDKKKKPKFN
jgi:hypothetical protein